MQDTKDNTGLIPGSGRYPGGGSGNPLQYSCLGNPMDRGARQAMQFMGHKESDMTEATEQAWMHACMDRFRQRRVSDRQL